MRKSTIILLAASLLTASVPAMAMTHAGMTGMAHDEQCQKECDMLVRNCGTEVESLQQRIHNLEAALKNDAGKYSQEQLGKLRSRLQDAEKTLADIQRGA